MLYLIALLEGFTTLAVQMIALRLATPIVGSSIILTSIFIGIILLALSAGYYLGGVVASRNSKPKISLILACFLLFTGLYYGLITFTAEEHLLERGLDTTNSYIGTLFFVAIALFFIPVCIAATTIPLLTELLPEDSKGKAAGSMLFASTIGSFIGSVGTSIVLFEQIGVRNTSVVTIAILLLCSILLLWKQHRKIAVVICAGGVILTIVLSGWYQQSIEKISGLIYHHDSAYQEIIIRDGTWIDGSIKRFFHTNRSFASGIDPVTKESPFDYLQEVMRLTTTLEPKRILVIGTAGFTYPHRLSKLAYVEQIDAIDIDPVVKPIAEKYFLGESLSPKVVFIPQSARYALRQAKKQGIVYDLILLDAYNGKSLPDELTTKEFFEDLKTIGKPEGIVFNFILDSGLKSDLANNVLTTVSEVFGETWTKNVSQNPALTFDNFVATVVSPDDTYQYYTPIGELYTDDQRSTETDLAMMRHGTP